MAECQPQSRQNTSLNSSSSSSLKSACIWYSHNRPSLNNDCFAQEVMSKQPDFQGQRGQLREELEATGNLMIFYPKFHCELNFIDRYFSLFLLYTFPQLDWTLGRFYCTAKYYDHENCECNLKGLRKTVTKALDSMTVSVIFHYYQQCMRIMDVYRSKQEYRTKQFTEPIYRGHRQVVDKAK